MSRIKTLDMLLPTLEDHPVNEWQKKEPYSAHIRAKETKRCNWSTTPFAQVPYTFHAYQTEKGDFQISLIKGLTRTALRGDDGLIIRRNSGSEDPDFYLLTVSEGEIPVLRALTFDHTYSKSYSEMWEDVLEDGRIQPLYETIDRSFDKYQQQLKKARERKFRALLR